MGLTDVTEVDEEESGEKKVTDMRSTLLEHGCWTVSRVTFVVLLIGITYLVKIPVDQLLRRDLEADMQKLSMDRALAQVQQINELTKVASAAHRDYVDALRSASRHAKSIRAAELEPLRKEQTQVRASLDRLSNKFNGRDELLSDAFERPFLDLIDAMNNGLDALGQVQEALRHSKATSTCFDASLELADNYMREIRWRGDIERQRLLQR